MTDYTPVEELVLLLIASLLPALIYLTWVRSGEGGYRERWGPILGAFVYGAIGATITAAIIEGILVAGGTAFSKAYPQPEFTFLNGNSTLGQLFLVLAIAPFVEEGIKAASAASYGDQFRTVADGPVFGASVGLGFGFFETALYGIGAWLTGGLLAGLELILIRSLSSILLHGAATAVFGYGYAAKRFGAPGSPAGTHYLAAVGLHSSFNALASLSVLVGLLVPVSSDLGNILDIVGLAGALLLSWTAIEYVRSLVIRSRFPGALAAHPRYRPPPVQSPRSPRTTR